MNVKDIRRENMRALARQAGGISEIAERLDKSQSQISHLIGSNPIKNIGDRIASEVEQAFNKPHGWLDREHFRVQEAKAIYELSDNHKKDNMLYRVVPILDWEDIRNWPALPTGEAHLDQQEMVPGPVNVSPRSFALRVRDDSMESTGGISFPVNSIIVIDPDHNVEHGAYVIVRIESDMQITFKQLMVDGKRRFLKPLNPRYPIIELNCEATFFGIIRQVSMIFA